MTARGGTRELIFPFLQESQPALKRALTQRVFSYAIRIVSVPEPAMQFKILPGTDMKVSRVSLGTMTWGEQNGEAEAHAQLDSRWSRTAVAPR